jgi:hypothetical protein
MRHGLDQPRSSGFVVSSPAPEDESERAHVRLGERCLDRSARQDRGQANGHVTHEGDE